MAAPRAVQLSRDRALALQRRLLEGYQDRRFKNALDDLERIHGGSVGSDFAAGRRALARQVQADPLPLHGFDATDEGVRQMVVQFGSFQDDAEIAALSAEIDAALRCDSRGGLTRQNAVALLMAQLQAFSTKEFQIKIQILQLESKAGPEDDGFHLEGRAPVALEEQREILCRHGFAPSLQGVLAMLGEVAKYAHVDEVAQLLDEVNMKLGMKQVACKLFRERLAERLHTTETAEDPRAPCVAQARLSSLFEGSEAAKVAAYRKGSEPRITKARATALFEDLLQEFNSQTFKDKLQVHIDSAISSGCKDLSNLPGRHELIFKVHRETLPLYGFEADAAGLAQLVYTLEPLMNDPLLISKAEAIQKALHMPKAVGKVPVAEALACPASAPGPFAKVQAVKLLSTLLSRYNSTTFQRKLENLRKSSAPPRNALKHMIRSVQVDVLPKFGFNPTDEGVKEMITAVESFNGDADVQRLLGLVGAALFPAGGAASSAAPEVGSKTLSRSELVSLLQEQLYGFSSAAFQSKIQALKDEWCLGENDDRFHLLGRDELALKVQCSILPHYGLEGTRCGVQDLRAQCARHVSDHVVARLLVETQQRLGMTPPACRHFLEQLRAEGTQPPREAGADLALRPGFAEAQEAHPLLDIAVSALPAATPRMVAPRPRVVAPSTATSTSPPTSPASASPGALPLTQRRAGAVITELELGLKTRKNRQSKKQPQLGEGRLAEAAHSSLLSEVLPRYGYQCTEEGLHMLLEAVRPHLAELGLEARAQTLREELLQPSKPEDLAKQVKPPAANEVKVAVPKISSEEASKLYDELLVAFSMPLFQKRLCELYRKHPMHSKEFAEGFSKLVAAETEGPLRSCGLPSSPQEYGTVCLALAPFFADESAQAVLNSVDEALFGPSGSLRSLVAVMRHQLAEFSKEPFQTTIQELKERASDCDKAEGFFRLPGRPELALVVQEKVLPEYGYEGSRRGVHALLDLAIKHSRIPLVAGLLDAMNTELGMRPRPASFSRQDHPNDGLPSGRCGCVSHLCSCSEVFHS